MRANWKPGVITACCADGDKFLPGWISSPFGLDWGVCIDTDETLWVVHHLPTGWSICALGDEVERAMQLVDLLRSLGDWSFTDVAGVKPMVDAVQIARASGFNVQSPRRVGRPTYPDCVERVA